MDSTLITDIDNSFQTVSKSCKVEDCRQYLSVYQKSLTILTQNIRSIYKNMDSFNIFLHRLNFNCDIVILTECWLSNRQDNLPVIPGYNVSFTRINNNQNDGVVVYSKDSLVVTVEEPNLHDCKSNCLIMKIGTTAAIIAIYRSPSARNLDVFHASLNQIFQALGTFKNVILTGDINININSDNCNAGIQDYLNICSFHGFMPAHTLPTHQSGSCLDHMIVKSNFSYITLVTNSTITDHHAVLLTLNLTLPKQNYPQTKTQLNTNKLEYDLCNIDFSPVFNTPDANFALSYLIKHVQSAILRNTAVITVKKKNYNIKPWITPGLIRCIRQRDKLHQRYRRDPDNLVTKITYTRYRNFCNKLLKDLKRNYDKNELNRAGNNSKQLWKHIKNVTYMSKQRESNSSLLLSNPSPILSANEVNNFFVNVGKTLAEQIPKPDCVQPSSQKCGNRRILKSFALLDTDEDEITRIICGLKDDCAVGWDNISNKTLKLFKHILVPPLTHIFRMCFSEGIFPRCLKKAIVIPIFKSGNKDLVNNYRPISLLPSISKILEKIINSRLVNYLEKNEFLSSAQFGFRAKLSTADAVHSLTDYVSEELGKGNQTLGIFLDLAKAFDTVSVSTLLYKLEALGIRGTPLKLFADYLDGRHQCVKIDNIISVEQKNTGFGVPQGSILGPTLFLIYINDLCSLNIKQGKIISYADDTALIFTAKTNSELYEYAQIGLNTVSNWLQSNLLTLNTDKTKYIHFSIRKPQFNMTNSQLYAHHCGLRSVSICKCPFILKTSNIKYLGVLIDESLSFRPHIDSLVARVRRLIFVFKKLRAIADKKLMSQVYLALGQSVIQYCITSWGGAPKTYLLPLERAQRAILKVANFHPFLYPTDLLYKSCNVLTVRQLFITHLVLKQHTMLSYNIESTNKRRNDIVCESNASSKYAFVNRFYTFLGPFLYNILNRKLSIYKLNNYDCKKVILQFLLSISYSETEDLLVVCK